MDLGLFRIKILLPQDPTLFYHGESPASVLRQMIAQRPTSAVWRRQAWHIGNVEAIDSDGLYFALGRTARGTRTILDLATGNFSDAEYDHAPYTHVVVDLPSEVCAIAKKTDLAPTIEALGGRLERVLMASDRGRELGATVRVSPLSDPDQFIRQLHEAYAIKSFTFGFTPPNAFDVNRDIIRPLEEFTRVADAATGSTTVRGEALAVGALEDVTRSAAATGDDVRARLQLTEGSRSVARSLRGGIAAVDHSELEVTEDRIVVLAKLREYYRRIRGANDE